MSNGVKGSYVLLIRMAAVRTTASATAAQEAEPGTLISIGRLGTFRFTPGFYAYVGSGLNGVRARVARHRRRIKTLHWHIDYLLQRADLVGVWVIQSEERLECEIASALLRSDRSSIPAPGFGSSDCACPSHLIGFPEATIPNTVKTLVDSRLGGLVLPSAALEQAGSRPLAFEYCEVEV